MSYREYNFDGLVGPTHNYAGLSVGNIASTSNKQATSKPREAALQGLKKMKYLADLGIPQAVLPPHERPNISFLRHCGFDGDSADEIIKAAAKKNFHLLTAASSASAMWTANAVTMTPSNDAADHRAHFTPANLFSKLHRSIESTFTQTVFETIFSDSNYFVVHDPLSGGEALRDEGAANHTRLAPDYSSRGLHLFVYGADSVSGSLNKQKRFAARQSKLAFEVIANRHQINPEDCFYFQQSPEAIDQGVFHNDVISVGNESTLLFHEQAFLNSQECLSNLCNHFEKNYGVRLNLIEVPANRVSISDAVMSYLFNSQLVQNPNGELHLIAPIEAQAMSNVSEYLNEIAQDESSPLKQVHYLDVRESMKNGGGPACLRQRIVLSDEEKDAIKPRVFLDDSLFQDLEAWIQKHYREAINPKDIQDPKLYHESCTALDELTKILRTGPIYPFQIN